MRKSSERHEDFFQIFIRTLIVDRLRDKTQDFANPCPCQLPFSQCNSISLNPFPRFVQLYIPPPLLPPRAVHASQFCSPFLNSNQICCLLPSIRRYDRGRDRGERPFFFGGPKSKAPLPLPLRCSVSALRLSPAPPLQILVACCLVSHCGSMILLLCVVKTAGWWGCPK